MRHYGDPKTKDTGKNIIVEDLADREKVSIALNRIYTVHEDDNEICSIHADGVCIHTAEDFDEVVQEIESKGGLYYFFDTNLVFYRKYYGDIRVYRGNKKSPNYIQANKNWLEQEITAIHPLKRFIFSVCLFIIIGSAIAGCI